MGNVIDLRAWTKSHAQNNKAEVKVKAKVTHKSKSVSPVVDISQKRSEALKTDRRQVKRTILTEFIAVHCVVPGVGLVKVSLYDLNEKGLSFDLEEKFGKFNVGEELALRLYINHQTYVPFTVQVKHLAHIADEGSHRHGTALTAESLNNVALHHFVKFLESVSMNLHNDRGDVTVSKINV